MGEMLGGGGGPEHKPSHNLENVGDHVRDLQEQARFSGGINNPQNQDPPPGEPSPRSWPDSPGESQDKEVAGVPIPQQPQFEELAGDGLGISKFYRSPTDPNLWVLNMEVDGYPCKIVFDPTHLNVTREQVEADIRLMMDDYFSLRNSREPEDNISNQ